MDELLDILKEAPVWVYALLPCLLFIGYTISKPRTIQLRRVFLLPAILILFSMSAAICSGFLLSTITHTFGLKSAVLYKWLWVLLGSFLVGFAETRKTVIQKGSSNYQMVSQGSWLTPFIIFVLFATKYYLGYSLANTPTKHLILADLLTWQFIAGYILGRSLSLGLKYHRRPIKA